MDHSNTHGTELSLLDRPHKPSWFELFFDLAFVAALASSVHIYRHDASHFGSFVLLYLIIWVMWTTTVFYMDRFAFDDPAHRIFQFVQMTAALVVAAYADHADKMVAIPIAFLAMRMATSLMYVRAKKSFRLEGRFIPTLLKVYSGSGFLWAVSLFVPSSWVYGLWLSALGLDLAAPVICHAVGAALLPVSAKHLVERFGLFAILVLGECIVGVGQAIHQASLNVSSLASLAITFGVWWLYFDNLDEDLEEYSPNRALAWEFVHLLLCFSILVLAQALYVLSSSKIETTSNLFASLATILGSIGFLHWLCYSAHGSPAAERFRLGARACSFLICAILATFQIVTYGLWVAVIVLVVQVAIDCIYEKLS